MASALKSGRCSELAQFFIAVFADENTTIDQKQAWINADPGVIVLAAVAADRGYDIVLANVFAAVLVDENTTIAQKQDWVRQSPNVRLFANKAAEKGHRNLAEAIAKINRS